MATLEEPERGGIGADPYEPRNALIKQYQRLFEMEGAELEVRDEAQGHCPSGDGAQDRRAWSAHHPEHVLRHHVRPAFAGGCQQGGHRRRRDQGRIRPYIIFGGAEPRQIAASD